MRNNLINRKGFTLVEMIVVIAIIAILAAVIIPTTAGFIDRARLSNDRQQAASMTRALLAMQIEDEAIANAVLDAQDVRDLLDSFTDEPFNFTPQARETGFFYLPDLNRVVAEKFDTINDPNYLIRASGPSINLLNLQGVVAATGLEDRNSPEELFGNGKVMLTTSGSSVALIVYGIRNNFSGELLANLNDPGFIASLLGGNKYQGLLENLLEEFNLQNTIFVTNSEWITTAANSGDVRRVIFAPNISHLPAYDLSFDITELPTINAPIRINTAAGAIDSSVRFARTAPRVVTQASLTNYSSEITYSNLTLDFSALSIRSEVVGYTITLYANELVNKRVRIDIFTRDGLVGFAVLNAIDSN